MVSVVICEDDPLQAMELAEHVTLSGCDVIGTFSSAADMRAALTTLRPDLALIDLNLADGDTGAALAVELAALGCRIVILSGSDEVQPALGRIAHTFVAKPLPMGVVGELTHLAGAAARQG